MIRRALLWVITSCFALNLLGFAVDAAWVKRGYFSREIIQLGHCPYWIFATLFLLVLNGIAIARNMSSYDPGVDWGQGRAGARVPLPHMRLLGLNMILVPILVMGSALGPWQ